MPSDPHAETKTPETKAPVKTRAPVARAKDHDEEPTPAPVSQKTLPTGLSRAIVIAALIFSVAYASVELLGDRYAISPVPNSPNSFVYRIDRLTGSLYFCGSQQCSVVHIRAAE